MYEYKKVAQISLGKAVEGIPKPERQEVLENVAAGSQLLTILKISNK